MLPPDDSGGIVEIDAEKFVEIVSYFPRCTRKWTAWHFGVSEVDLEKYCQHHFGLNFADTKSMHYETTKMKMSFRVHQLAMAGSLQALQWVGMNQAGESFKNSENVKAPPSERVVINLKYSEKDIRKFKDVTPDKKDE